MFLSNTCTSAPKQNNCRYVNTQVWDYDWTIRCGLCPKHAIASVTVTSHMMLSTLIGTCTFFSVGHMTVSKRSNSRVARQTPVSNTQTQNTGNGNTTTTDAPAVANPPQGSVYLQRVITVQNSTKDWMKQLRLAHVQSVSTHNDMMVVGGTSVSPGQNQTPPPLSTKKHENVILQSPLNNRMFP